MTEEQTKAEVKKAVVDSWTAWRNHDIELWERVVHPEFYGYYFGAGLLGEPNTEGKFHDGVRAWWEAGQRSTMSPSHVAVRLVGNDSAIATYYIQGSESYPEGNSIEGTWRATSVMVREGGSWKGAHYHFSPLTTSQTERVAHGGSDSTLSRNKAAVRRLIEEIWHKGNPAAIDELFAADYVFHGPASTKAELHGPDGYRQVVRTYRTGFPDIRFTIEQLVEEGDWVVCRWVTRATHKGELAGVPATGRKSQNPGVSLFRFAGGKIAEERSYWDERHLWHELGVSPPAR